VVRPGYGQFGGPAATKSKLHDAKSAHVPGAVTDSKPATPLTETASLQPMTSP
jgi:hypothetical protein